MAISLTTLQNIRIALMSRLNAEAKVMSSMAELGNELEAACKSIGVIPGEIPERQQILQIIKKKFVNGDPRAWWTCLAPHPQIYEFENNTGYLHLEEIAPRSSENVWFIADEDNELMHLYKLPLKKLKDIIGECRYFEYYVVDENFSWLIAENDHGNLLLVEKDEQQA